MTDTCRRQKYNIAFASDLSQIPYISVSMISILENAKNSSDYNFHYVINDIPEPDKQKLTKLANKYHAQINFYSFDNSKIENWPYPDYLNNVYPMYYRLFLGELLEESIEKILYLDTDTMVLHDLEDLFNQDMNNCSMGVVIDTNAAFNKKQLNHKEIKLYFNSGVILMDLKKFRNDNILQKFEDYIANNNEKSIYGDQDVLNVVMADDIFELDPSYNVMLQSCYFIDSPENAIFDNIKEARIVHFVGVKPWHGAVCLNPYRKEWFKYALKSPYFLSHIFKIKLREITDNIFSIKNECKLFKENNIKMKQKRKVLRFLGIKIVLKKHPAVLLED